MTKQHERYDPVEECVAGIYDWNNAHMEVLIAGIVGFFPSFVCHLNIFHRIVTFVLKRKLMPSKEKPYS